MEEQLVHQGVPLLRQEYIVWTIILLICTDHESLENQ